MWTLPQVLQHDPYIKIVILDLLTILGTSFHWSLPVARIVFCLQLYVKLNNNKQQQQQQE